MKPDRKQILKRLFFSTLYLSTFTFGGGYVIVSLLKKKFVDEYHWINEEEMLDLVAIAQASPGSVAVNGAIVVGCKLAGIPGILASVLGAILPPMVIITLISAFYTAFSANPYVAALLGGMRAGVSAVIVSVVFDMGRSIIKAGDWINVAVMLLCFFVSCCFQISTIWIILAALLFGILRTRLIQPSMIGRRKL